MANNFNIVGKIALQGPNNIRAVVKSIQSQLNTISAPININIPSSVNNRLNTLNTNLARVNTNLVAIRASGLNASQALTLLANTLGTIKSNAQGITVAYKNLSNITKAANNAAGAIHSFGGQAGLAVRRFLAFAAPTSIFLGLVTAIKSGVSAAIDFEKEMTRVSQVTGKSVAALADISGEITRLATGLGVSSKELGGIATTLAQAGLSARDTKTALEALARSSLAATFTDINQTTEGAIAVFRQFNVSATDLQGVIGSLNSVSAQFAVESDDLISAIRRTGGAFKTSGGSLNELLGLFTSVRATTRESADSIATGFRTIFTRIQRPKTIQFLKELGVELQDVKGQFVGPVESIRRLNAALADVATTDPRFAAVIEELGGFRQVSKVIPLIQQFPEALKAISVAEQGQQSIVEDSITAQKSLANQLVKTKEEFLALFRELTSDKSFQFFIKTSLELARSIIDITKAVKPLIPLLGSLAVIQGARGAGAVGSNFLGALSGKRRFASGGKVPGAGNSDNVPALLTPGEFVVNKKAAAAVGFDKLAKMNKMADGGPVRKFAVAGLQPTGFHTHENVPIKTDVIVGGKAQKISENVDIVASGLSQDFANRSENLIRKRVGSAASDMAVGLQKQIGVQGASQPADLDKVLNKAGFTAIVGNIFEAALSLAGAPYTNVGTAIDFPSGLGALSKIYGPAFPSNVPTDAKRTADIKDFKRRNLPSFLRAEVLNGAKSSRSSTAAASVATKDFSSIKSGKKFFTTEIARMLGNEKLKKDELLANPDVNKNFIFDTKKGFIKRAAGGSIPGSGKEDNVPSLLTPGEFVINKESVQRIGIDNLKKLNGGGFQKFARGGSVGGPNVGGGFAIASIAGSLIPSFVNLEKESSTLLKNFIAVAGAASVAAFGLKSLASEQKLTRLSRLGQGSLGSPRSTNPLVQTTSLLAKNFNILAGATAAVAAVTTIWGQSIQDTAAITAKNAKSEAQLNKAIESDKRGATGVGIGVGISAGAALGTIIAPGVGTAIGAAAGAGVGAVLGPILANNEKALIAAFRQAKFESVSDKLDTLFDDFANNRVPKSQSIGGIGSEVRNQISNIRGTADLEQRGELTKQFRNNLVNIRTQSQAIADNVSTLNEFKTSFGGAGESIIEAISLLTKKSIPEIEKEINNEISIRNKSKTSIAASAAALARFSQISISLNVFVEALHAASDTIESFSNKIDNIESLSSGGISGTRFNSIPSNLFERAAAGQVNNVGRVSSAAGALTSGNSQITKDIEGITTLTNELPTIVKNLSKNVGLEQGDEAAQVFFNKEIDLLTGVSDALKNSVKDVFSSGTNSRQGGSESGIIAAIREDLHGFASKLIPESSKSQFSQLTEILKLMQEQLDVIGKNLVQQAQLELNITKSKVSLEDKILEFTRSRLRENEHLTLNQVQKTNANRRSAILSNTAFAGTSNAPVENVLNRLSELKGLREAANNTVNSSSVTDEQRLAAQKEFVELGAESNRLRDYLKDLADSTSELTHQQEALGRAEADRKSGRSLTEGLLLGSSADRVKFSRFTKNAVNLQGSKKSFFELGPQSRQEFDDLLSKLPQNRNLSLLGGKNVQAFRDEQLRKFAGNTGNADFQKLVDELISGNKDENAIRKNIDELQKESLNASRALIQADTVLAKSLDELNTTLAKSFVDDKKRTEIDAQIKPLSGTKKSLESEVRAKNDDITRLETFTQNFLGKEASNSSIEEINRINANLPTLQKRTAALNKAKSFDEFNIDSSKVQGFAQHISKTHGIEGRFGGTLGTKIDSDTAAKLVQDIIPKNSDLGADFEKKIRERLDNISFIGVGQNSRVGSEVGGVGGFKGIGANAEANTSRGQTDFNVVGEAGVKKLIESIINDEILAFKTGGAASANAEAAGSFNILKNKGIGSDTINTLSTSDNLERFTREFGLLNVELLKGKDPFDTYISKIHALNEEIGSISTKIETLKASAPPAPTKAGGGFIGGRSVRHPFVSFAPRGSDTVPAMLTAGEFVVRKQAAEANGPLLEAINAEGFANGGFAAARKAKRSAFRDAKRARSAAFNPLRQARLEAASTRRRQNFTANLGKPKFSGELGTIGGNAARIPGIIAANAKRASAEASNIKIQHAFELERSQSFVNDRNATASQSLKDNRTRVAAAAVARKDRLASLGLGTKGVGTDSGTPLIGSTPDIPLLSGEGLSTPSSFNPDFNKLSDLSHPSSFIDEDIPFAEDRRRRAFATGGGVPGFGSGDTVPALLTPGEFVLNKRAAKAAGMSNLANFNQKFANGGQVSGGGGGEGNQATLAALGQFSEASSALANALSRWSGSADRLSESISSFPSEVQVNHSPITVAVNIAGLEGLESAVADKVLAAVNERLGQQKAKASDGKAPFFAK